MANFHEKKLGFSRFAADGTKMHYYDIVVDTAADIPDPAEHPEWEIGSELVVLENGGSKYQLSNAREWVAVNFNSGGGGETVDTLTEAFTEIVDGTKKAIDITVNSQSSINTKGLFAGCNFIKSFYAPNIKYAIGNETFLGCENLEAINFPIAAYAGTSTFENCPSLRTVHLPSLKFVYERMFFGCESLTVVELSEADLVDAFAFSGCKSLVTIDLPIVRRLSDGAFYGCENLKALILRRTDKIVLLHDSTDSYHNLFDSGNGMLYNSPINPATSNQGYIYVPKNLVNDYKNSQTWKDVVNQFRAIEDYPEICG